MRNLIYVTLAAIALAFSANVAMACGNGPTKCHCVHKCQTCSRCHRCHRCDQHKGCHHKGCQRHRVHDENLH